MPQTLTEARACGYETGYDWDQFYPHNNYVPGGPFICSEKYSTDVQWKRYCLYTEEVNGAWRMGWHEGRQAFLRDLPVLFRLVKRTIKYGV